MPKVPGRTAVREELEVYYKLNGREMDILKELSRGKTVRETAVSLDMSVGHVDKRINSLRKKFTADGLDDLRLIGRWLRSGVRTYPTDMYRPEVMTCDECGTENLQFSMFPAYPVDVRCESCVLRYVLSAKKASHRKEISRSLKQILEKTRKSVELPDVNELLGTFADAHGGIARVAEEWHKHVQTAAESSPGSKYVLDHYRDFVRLLMKANETNPANIDSMEEDDLREYLTNMVLANLAEDNKEDLLSVIVPPAENEGVDGETVRKSG